MKYWLLTTEYPPFYGGGISTYCHLTAAMLAENGHSVSVFVNDGSVADYLISFESNVRIVRFNPSRTKSYKFLGYHANLSFEFAAIARHFIESEGSPDIVEAQEYTGIAYYLLQFKKMEYDWCAGLQILITAHSPSFLYQLYNNVPVYRYPHFFTGEMERFCLQAADLVISPSHFLVTEIRKYFNWSNTSISIVPNPAKIEVAHFPQAPPGKNNEALFYGKLSVQKGAFRLIDYFLQYWVEGGTLNLRMVGGQDIFYHPERRTMGEIIKNRYSTFIRSERLILENKIAPSDMKKHLQNASVVIIPSIIDNFPYAVLETMAMGHILLVSKQGGQAEMIEDGVDGFIFDHEVKNSFICQLKRIEKLQQEERTDISTKARMKVQRLYNFHSIYKQKMNAISLMGKRGDEKNDDWFPFVSKPSNRPSDTRWPVQAGLLSVIIPCFNLGKYLDEAVTSIEASDYPLKEIIIVDDGSTDPQTINIIKLYKSRLGIKLIEKANEGVAIARNTGAAVATGEFMAFLDADDFVYPSYYSRAITVLRKYENVHFVGSWVQYFGDSRVIWPTFNPEPPGILYHNIVNSSALVYKRSAFLNSGINDSAMPFTGWEDYESVIAMLAAGYQGVALPEPLFFYRVRNNSMVRSLSAEKKLLLYQYIQKKHSVIYKFYALDIFNLVRANGAGIQTDNPTLDYELGKGLPFTKKISNSLIRLIKSNVYLRPIAIRLYRLIKK